MVALSYCEVVTYAVLAVCRKTHYRGSFKKKKHSLRDRRSLFQKQSFDYNASNRKKRKYGRTPIIRTPVIRTSNCPEGLALRVHLSEILQNQFALILPVIGSSTVQCYGFYNCKSGVVERLRGRYIL